MVRMRAALAFWCGLRYRCLKSLATNVGGGPTGLSGGGRSIVSSLSSLSGHNVGWRTSRGDIGCVGLFPRFGRHDDAEDPGAASEPSAKRTCSGEGCLSTWLSSISYVDHGSVRDPGTYRGVAATDASSGVHV